MKYDLNYLIYSSLLINYQKNPQEIANYVKSSNVDLNLIIIKNDSVILKYPSRFFPFENVVYSTISDTVEHPYQSESDFRSLIDSLNVSYQLPNKISEASFGVWENSHYADYVETSDGYKYYIIMSDFIEEDNIGLANDGILFFYCSNLLISTFNNRVSFGLFSVTNFSECLDYNYVYSLCSNIFGSDFFH